MEVPPLDRGARISLAIQRTVARALTPLTYLLVAAWMRLGRGYRIEDIRRVRRWFRRELAPGRGPALICANHLTLIDSTVLIWAMAPWWRLSLRPGMFPWNLPEKRNFHSKGLALRLLCYAGKCIAVVRQGPPEESRRALRNVEQLLKKGEAIMIFPEGTRSRSGRVDPSSCTYGVGTILQRVPNARVVCVYLRGRGQETWSDLPRKGEVFDLDARVLYPATAHEGLRGARDLSRQVISEIAAMERTHFDGRADARQ